MTVAGLSSCCFQLGMWRVGIPHDAVHGSFCVDSFWGTCYAGPCSCSARQTCRTLC